MMCKRNVWSFCRAGVPLIAGLAVAKCCAVRAADAGYGGEWLPLERVTSKRMTNDL
jgi:hypothetical protein